MDKMLSDIKRTLDDVKIRKREVIVRLARDLKEGKIGDMQLSDLSDLSRVDIEKLIEGYFLQVK